MFICDLFVRRRSADRIRLVNSGRPQAAVTADLVEFFGEQHAEALGAFLAKLYKDYVVPQQQQQQSKKISLKRTREESAPIMSSVDVASFELVDCGNVYDVGVDRRAASENS
jgi:hypothetical protein